jgi:hypothetical protein
MDDRLGRAVSKPGELPARATLYGRRKRRPEPWDEMEERGRQAERIARLQIELALAERAKEEGRAWPTRP